MTSACVARAEDERQVVGILALAGSQQRGSRAYKD